MTFEGLCQPKASCDSPWPFCSPLPWCPALRPACAHVAGAHQPQAFAAPGCRPCLRGAPTATAKKREEKAAAATAAVPLGQPRGSETADGDRTGLKGPSAGSKETATAIGLPRTAASPILSGSGSGVGEQPRQLRRPRRSTSTDPGAPCRGRLDVRQACPSTAPLTDTPAPNRQRKHKPAPRPGRALVYALRGDPPCPAPSLPCRPRR